MSQLKLIRASKRMTQKDAALAIGISLRSYKTYENDPKMQKMLKYTYLCERLEAHIPVDEKHGILTEEDIRRSVRKILNEYEGEVRYAVLYGAYAKDKKPHPADTVDLLVCTRVSGLRFYDMKNRLRDALRKNVLLTESRELMKNESLLDEILTTGKRIY